MTASTQEIGFLKPLESAIALCDSLKSIVVKTADDYTAAEDKRKQAREYLDMLDEQYKSHPIVMQAKAIQQQKIALENRLKEFNKEVKAGPMRKFEDAQEAIRKAEEFRLSEIARKEAAAETARLVAEQKKAFDKAEKERKAAEAIAAKSRDAATRAAAQEAARQAVERQELARQEAAAIKADAAAAPAPTVVLERSTPTVSRRKVFRWRLTTKDGRKILKADMTASTRLKIGDLWPMPSHLFILSPILLNEFVDQQGESAAIPGVLEVKSEMV